VKEIAILVISKGKKPPLAREGCILV
jgi:hypothetical protein